MELNLVDPLAEPVVCAERRRMLVCEAAELERLPAAQPPERRAALFLGAGSFPPQSLYERSVLGEPVVAGERRRLVRRTEPRLHASSIRHRVRGRRSFRGS